MRTGDLGSAVQVSAKRRHGPLSDIRGALWVLLQGFHDLTVVQHQSHELVLLLGLCRGAVDGADQFQLLKVLKGLRTEQRGGQDWRTRVLVVDEVSASTFMMTGVSKL